MYAPTIVAAYWDRGEQVHHTGDCVLDARLRLGLRTALFGREP